MEPALTAKTIAALKDRFGDLPPKLRKAAKYIVDHPSEFGLDPIRDTARKAGVSTYTLVNMSKNLGFSGYEAFRLPFRSALITGARLQDNPLWFDELRGQSEVGAAFADAAENTISIVTHSLERQQLSEMEAIVETLRAAKNVYVNGTRTSYAIAVYFHYVGRIVMPSMQLIPQRHTTAQDDLNHAGPGDVLVAMTVTPFSHETIEACKFAKEKGMILLLITDSAVALPELVPDFTLVSTVESTNKINCISGMMAVIELLLALLLRRAEKGAIRPKS